MFVYAIKSSAKPNQYLFCSNDNTRKFKDDFDVRTHSFKETRNNWIIQCHGWSVFTIRSETNPDQFLFVATDKSNNHDKDFDVRTQNKENQNNHWYIVTNPNFSTPYPLKHDLIIVTFNPAHLQQNFLTIGDSHKSFSDDFSVNVKQNRDQHSKFILDRVTGDAFAIRSFFSPRFTQLLIIKKNQINFMITMSDFILLKNSEISGQFNKQNSIFGPFNHQLTLINIYSQSKMNLKMIKAFQLELAHSQKIEINGQLMDYYNNEYLQQDTILLI
ncbi:unnamed protein product (macronuclear) [Paramecium tetraurelia]|uniref:Ricin B lectin domain-containing protein n=1 Tax=Paramecium tetraurelia TaxID=5888 RepID=A0CLB6_PARTE|nr:uncharacterized protein GSPATT00008131001 [Paramecium tetraurelia]CAK71583.1 unnamed protein product [Paramecium tetraurelia]|eukprot:XP_001438980.1 hypothetical protein (macronuclear) [Paramecium tetraurelia strain d4-2]